MKIRVRYFTFLREKTGKTEEEYEFEREPTVEEVVRLIGKKYGKKVENYLFSKDGKPNKSLTFLINGKNVIYLDMFETKLSDGDVLYIVPLIEGG